MESRRARVLRGMLASAVAILVAALSHVAGGGDPPGVVPLALSMAFATLASIALTSRRLSLWRLSASVGLSQFLFHALFSLGGPAVTFLPTGSVPGGMAHVHGDLHLTMAMGQMPAVHSPASPAMWVMHAVAAVVTVIALRFGERAFWGLFETARVRVARFAARITATPVPVPRVFGAGGGIEVVLPRRLGLPLARLRHRGPPGMLGAA